MTRVFKLLGGLAVGIGLIWVLQGLNILPGSFMTGDRQWAINGAVTIAGGAGLLFLGNRKPKPKA